MKRTVFVVVIVVFMAFLMTGCLYVYQTDSTNNAMSNEATTEATTTETTTETTTNITYKTYTMMNIKYKVPEKWYCIKKESSDVYLPNRNNDDINLEVGYFQSGRRNPSKSIFDSMFDSVLEELTMESDISSTRINSSSSEQFGDFYIGHADFNAVKNGTYWHMKFQVVCDSKTGVIYLFLFSSPESISKENMDALDEIFKSVSLR